MRRIFKNRGAEAQQGDTKASTPKDATREKSKIRRFLSRGVHVFSRIFSVRRTPCFTTSTEPLDCKEEEKSEDMTLRPGSATSRQFLYMSEIFAENGYMVGPKIGSGNYAKVRVVERRADGKILAAKIILRHKAPKDYIKNFMPRELEILKTVKHENIAEVYDVVDTDKLVFIVMDYAPRGDLLEYIKNIGAPKEVESRRFFKQVSNAVLYLHKNGIVHRDLKCENILLKKDGDVVLTDFGFARKFEEPTSRTFCGSAAYASPQLIEGIPYNPYKNDAWGLGCILFILACGSMPYDDSNIKKMMKKQKETVYFPSKVRDKVNPVLKDLITRILDKDEETRCNVAEMVTDAWVLTETTLAEGGEKEQEGRKRDGDGVKEQEGQNKDGDGGKEQEGQKRDGDGRNSAARVSQSNAIPTNPV